MPRKPVISLPASDPDGSCAAAVLPELPLAALYDFSGLGKLARHPAFVREMQQLFVDRVPSQLAQLRTIIAAQDWPTLVLEAHSLKATFGTLRMEPGATLLGQLESLAGQPGQPPLLPILDLVAHSAAAVISLFEQELQRPA